MEIKTYRRRREGTAQVARFDGSPENAREIMKWAPGKVAYQPGTVDDPRESLRVVTPIGTKEMFAGHYLARTGEGDFLPMRPEAFEQEYIPVDDEDSWLVKHARHELSLFPNEDPDFLESIMNTVKAFASYKGHSGSSAEIAVHMVHMLLGGWNLLDLTDDPAEWAIKPGKDYGLDYDMWQNTRNSKALSLDGGKTYWFVGEKDPNVEEGADDRVWYVSLDHTAEPEIDPEDLKSDSEKEDG